LQFRSFSSASKVALDCRLISRTAWICSIFAALSSSSRWRIKSFWIGLKLAWKSFQVELDSCFHPSTSQIRTHRTVDNCGIYLAEQTRGKREDEMLAYLRKATPVFYAYDRSSQTLNDTSKQAGNSPRSVCRCPEEYQMLCSYYLQSSFVSATLFPVFTTCTDPGTRASGENKTDHENEFHWTPNETKHGRCIQKDLYNFRVLLHRLQERLNPLQILGFFGFPLFFLNGSHY
jgi:hypothetical protein